MAAQDATRASDADRERVIAALREHAAAGRLDMEELAERAGAATRARTVGELAPLMEDLPSAVTPARLERPPARRGRATDVDVFKRHLGIFVVMSLFFVGIWLAGGADSSFWPAWAMLGWSVGLGVQALRIFAPASGGDARRRALGNGDRPGDERSLGRGR